MRATESVARKIFLIATEESGDRLGAKLMKVLRQRLGGAVRFEGVGGRAMAREGLASLFPIEELSIVGLAAVRQLPKILRLIRETADAVLRSLARILVIIDSPDFTHRVARRVRARDPSIPIVDYVSPSVWAWRSGRARAMRRLYRPRAGAAAVRTGGLSRAARPALQLCRSSPDRTARRASARRGRAKAPGPAAAGASGSAGKPPQRDPAPHGGVRRNAGPVARRGGGVRIDPAHHAAFAGSGDGGRQRLAGAATDRGRRAGKAGGVPDRPCRLRQIRHHDARTRDWRGADGDAYGPERSRRGSCCGRSK